MIVESLRPAVGSVDARKSDNPYDGSYLLVVAAAGVCF